MNWTVLSPELIQQKGQRDAINIGGMIFFPGLLFTAAVFLVGAVSNTFPVLAVAMFVFFAFGVAAMAAALYFYIRATTKRADKVMDRGLDFLDYEIKRKMAALELPATTPAALPPLPATEETFKLTRNGVGEGDVPKNLLHGFDPRDLAFLFRHLARGGKWTEEYMEKWELPYSHEVMGKAEEGTPYTRFMQLCTDAEIIVGRAPKKAGKLMVTDAGEMMTKVKTLE